MTGEAIFVLAVVVATLVLWVLEIWPVDLVALLAMLVLVGAGVISIDEALSGFGNPALITVACMFVLSAGIIRTGALDAITAAVLAASGGRKVASIVVLMLTVAVLSAFMNNTPVAVIFLPIVLDLARRLDVAPSRLLIPMSYATILGGTSTLIGTSTNLLVSQAVERAGREPLGMFEFSVPGVIYALAGLGFLALAGPRLLPRRESVSSSMGDERMREYVTEIQFLEGSPLVGRSYQEVLGARSGLVPLMVLRGDEVYHAPLIAEPRTQFIRAGDVVLLKGEPGSLESLLTKDGVSLPQELGAALDRRKGRVVTMVELVVNPNSPLIGRTIADAGFSHKHGDAAVIAILRRNEHLRARVSEIRIRMGDTLLVLAEESRLEDLRNTDEFIMIEGVGKHLVRRNKAPMAVAILALVVTVAATGWLPMSLMALVGSVAMVLSGCLTLRGAYAAIDASVVVLIAATLALGRAMESSGAVTAVCDGMSALLADLGPHAVLAGLFLLAAAVNALISNNAVAVLFTPIAIGIASSLGYGAEPFIFGVLFGASCDFSTPIGYQTNLFVYGPGGYRFSDYARIGVPLTLVLFAVAMILIPWWWPFTAVT